MPPNNPDTPTTGRLGDLLGATIEDRDGRELGHLADVRLRPTRTDGQPTLRIEGLILGRRQVGSLLGYERGQQHGPWLLAALIRRLHKHVRLVPWSDVDTIDTRTHPPRIRLRPGYTLHSPEKP